MPSVDQLIASNSIVTTLTEFAGTSFTWTEQAMMDNRNQANGSGGI